MKTIKIKFVDWGNEIYKEENGNIILRILKERYNVILSDTPDYIIYSVWGSEHLKYDCIRIFIAGEHVSPCFDICDYAMGWDDITFGDRYIRRFQPGTNISDRGEDFLRALLKHKPIEYLPVEKKVYGERIYNDEEKYEVKYPSIEEKKFCNFIYTNGNADKIRREFFEKLNKYKKVDSIGKYLNNVGYTIGKGIQDKFEAQKKYKFSIAFENESGLDYTTEKILDAFITGTIPIYWGNPNIGNEFNEKAFINCHSFENFDEVIELIKKIDNDDQLYNEYITQPIFNDNSLPASMNIESGKKFLFSIFDQDIEKAKRRNDWWINTILKFKERKKMKEALSKSCINYIFRKKKLVGWGAGNGINVIVELFKSNNIEIKFEYLIDSNEEKNGSYKDNVPIYSPTNLTPNSSKDVYIIVLSYSYYDEIKKDLLKLEFEEFEDFIGLDHLMMLFNE